MGHHSGCPADGDESIRNRSPVMTCDFENSGSCSALETDVSKAGGLG